MNKLKRAATATALATALLITPVAAAEATPTHAVAAASGPCTGASVPWIFHWSGWATFGWWFMTGCKSQ